MANPSIRPLPFLVSAAFVLPFGCWGQWNLGNYNVPRHCQSKIHGQGEKIQFNTLNAVVVEVVAFWRAGRIWWVFCMCLLTPSTPLLRVNTLVIPRWIAIFCFCYGCRSKKKQELRMLSRSLRLLQVFWLPLAAWGGLWLKSLPSAMPFETPVTGMVQVALWLSLAVCQSLTLNVMIRVSPFVRNNQLCP